MYFLKGINSIERPLRQQQDQSRDPGHLLRKADAIAPFAPAVELSPSQRSDSGVTGAYVVANRSAISVGTAACAGDRDEVCGIYVYIAVCINTHNGD